MEISVTNLQETVPVSLELEQVFYKLKTIAAQELNLPKDAVVDVVLVDDTEMARLNLEYRGIDATTDVLSFAIQDNLEGVAEFPGEDNLLGDIVISLPKALEQSEAYGHSLTREVGFLFVHGLLHLLGFDHIEPEAETTMFSMQDKLLGLAGMQRVL